MKFCSKCGKELMDEAVICVGCGCNVVENEEHLQQNRSVSVKIGSKINIFWIIIGAVVLLLGIVFAILFVPRNLKMDDFKETNVVSAVMRYGIPERIDSDEESGVYLVYDSKVDFYGITPYSFIVYPDEDEVTFFFHNEDAYDVYKKIDRYCDLEDNLMGVYHIFSYENLEITTNDYDGHYVNIQIN